MIPIDHVHQTHLMNLCVVNCRYTNLRTAHLHVNAHKNKLVLHTPYRTPHYPSSIKNRF